MKILIVSDSHGLVSELGTLKKDMKKMSSYFCIVEILNYQQVKK
ncbi:hypothetical protein AAHH67_10735 [Niallia circulans]